MQAMIFAAGLGTRLLHETAHKPKALVEVGGKPLLQYAIEYLTGQGVSQIVINVHHFAAQVKSFLKTRTWPVPVLVSDESDQLLDTGGGLKKAASLFKPNEPVVVYNVDILSSLDLRKLLQAHTSTGAEITLVVRNRQTQRYLLFDDRKRLSGWRNKRTGEELLVNHRENISEMAFSGIHIINPEIIQAFPEQSRFPIVPVYLELSKNHPIYGYFDDSKLWMDVGKPAELEKARNLFATK